MLATSAAADQGLFPFDLVPTAEPIRYQDETATVELGKRQQLGYRSFKNANPRYFAAFAIDLNNDYFYWIDNTSSMEAAHRIAKTGCHVTSNRPNTECKIYEAVRPVGGAKASSLGDFPQELVLFVIEELPQLVANLDATINDISYPADKNATTYFGVSNSPAGGWAVSAPKQRKSLAASDAREQCELIHGVNNLDSFIYEFDISLFKILKRNKVLTCSDALVFSVD